MLCDTTSSSWSLKIVGGCLEAPSLPPLSHLKWFIYGKSRVIQGNLYKNIQGNLGKTEGNRRKSRETRGKNSIKSWSYVGDSMIHRASENPPNSKRKHHLPNPYVPKPLFSKVFGPQKTYPKDDQKAGKTTRWAPYQL